MSKRTSKGHGATTHEEFSKRAWKAFRELSQAKKVSRLKKIGILDSKGKLAPRYAST